MIEVNEPSLISLSTFVRAVLIFSPSLPPLPQPSPHSWDQLGRIQYITRVLTYWICRLWVRTPLLKPTVKPKPSKAFPYRQTCNLSWGCWCGCSSCRPWTLTHTGSHWKPVSLDFEKSVLRLPHSRPLDPSSLPPPLHETVDKQFNNSKTIFIVECQTIFLTSFSVRVHQINNC